MSKQLTYKWALTNNKFVYLTNNNASGLPFITTQEISITKENDISKKVENFTEEEYEAHYNLMWDSVLANDSDAKKLAKLDYTYYWNIDNSDCGIVEYGYKGKDGRGIAKINRKVDELGLAYLEIVYTDGTIENNIYLPVGSAGADGKDGVDGADGADGKDENVLIVQLSSMSASIDEAAREELNEIKKDLEAKYTELSGITDSYKEDLQRVSGQVTTTAEKIGDLSAGMEETVAKTIGGLSGSVTEYKQQVSTLSGLMDTVMTSYNSATSATTQYQQQIDTLNGKYSTCMSRLNTATNNMVEWKEQYDAELNRYSNFVSEMTNSGEFSASELFQTANQIRMMVTQSGKGGSDLTAAIVASINNSKSQIELKADKIFMLGETVASSLTAVDLNINKGFSYFGKDGSGYLANKNISWDNKGNLKINADFELGTIAENLQNEDVTLSKAACKFSKDGSGYLANGNISWTETGDLTIKNNVRIEGALTVGDVARELNTFDVAFCSDNHGGYNCLFKSDGGGYLGGGAIAWTNTGDTYITGDVHIGGNLPKEVSNYLNLNNTELANGKVKANADGSVSIGDGFNCSPEGIVTIESSAIIKGNLSVNELYAGEIYKDGDNKSKYPIELRKNGSGQLAKGNIYWDEEGNITFGLNSYGSTNLGGFESTQWGLVYSDDYNPSNDEAFDIYTSYGYLLLSIGEGIDKHYSKYSVASHDDPYTINLTPKGINLFINSQRTTSNIDIDVQEKTTFGLCYIQSKTYACKYKIINDAKDDGNINNYKYSDFLGNTYKFLDTLIIDRNYFDNNESGIINLTKRKIGSIVILKNFQDKGKNINLDITKDTYPYIQDSDVYYLTVYNYSTTAIDINLYYVQISNGELQSGENFKYYKSDSEIKQLFDNTDTKCTIYGSSIGFLVIYDNSIYALNANLG